MSYPSIAVEPIRYGLLEVGSGGGGGTDPDAQAWIDRIEAAGGILTADEKTAMNAFVVACKNGTIDFYAALHDFDLFAGRNATAGLERMKSATPMTKGSEVADRHFTQYGYDTENAVNHYIDTGDIPNAIFTGVEDFSFGLSYHYKGGLDRYDSETNNNPIYGAQDSASSRVVLTHQATRQFHIIGDQNVEGGLNKIGNGHLGIRVVTAAAGIIRPMYNGLLRSETAVTQAGTLPVTNSIYYGGRNDGVQNANDQGGGVYHCGFSFTSGLTAAQAQEFTLIVRNLMIAFGRYIHPDVQNWASPSTGVDVTDPLTLRAVSEARMKIPFNIWDKIAQFVPFVGDAAASLRNVCENGDVDPTEPVAPDYDHGGKRFDGSTEYVNSNHDPNSWNGGNINNIQMGYYLRDEIAAGTSARTFIGAQSGADQQTSFKIPTTGTLRFLCGVRVQAVDFTIAGNLSGMFYMGYDTVLEQFYLGNNGSDIQTLNQAISGPFAQTFDITVNTNNNQGTLGSYAPETCGGYFIAYDLTKEQCKTVAEGLRHANEVYNREVTNPTDSLAKDAYFENRVATTTDHIGSEDRAIGKLIDDLVDAGEWSKLGSLHILARREKGVDNNYLYDIARNAGAGTMNHATARRRIDGLSADGTSEYMDTLTSWDDIVAFNSNIIIGDSAVFAALVTERNTVAATHTLFGQRSANSRRTNLRFTTTTYNIGLWGSGNNLTDTLADTDAARLGLWSAFRTAQDNAGKLDQDDTTIDPGPPSASGVTGSYSRHLYVHGTNPNTDGVANEFTTARIALVFTGQGDMVSGTYSPIFNRYLDDLKGANISSFTPDTSLSQGTIEYLELVADQLTNPQILAVITLEQELKSGPVHGSDNWRPAVAIYPHVGQIADQNKNMKQRRFDWTTGPTASSPVALSQGTHFRAGNNDSWNNGFLPKDEHKTENLTYAVMMRHEIGAAGTDMGMKQGNGKEIGVQGQQAATTENKNQFIGASVVAPAQSTPLGQGISLFTTPNGATDSKHYHNKTLVTTGPAWIFANLPKDATNEYGICLGGKWNEGSLNFDVRSGVADLYYSFSYISEGGMSAEAVEDLYEAIFNFRLTVEGITDADARTFIKKHGFAKFDYWAPIQQLILDLKGQGSTTNNSNIWSKIVAYWPQIGDKNELHNADLKGAYDIPRANSEAINQNNFSDGIGINWNGTSDYILTTFNPEADGTISLNNSGMFYYERQNVAGSPDIIMGVYGGDDALRFYLVPLGGGGAFNTFIGSNVGRLDYSHANTQGFWHATRFGAGPNGKNLFHNGVDVTPATALDPNATQLPNFNMALGSWLNQTTPGSYWSGNTAGQGVTTGSWTAGEEQDLYDAIQTFNTTFGRQV